MEELCFIKKIIHISTDGAYVILLTYPNLIHETNRRMVETADEVTDIIEEFMANN